LGFANISEWEKSMNQNLINNVQKEYPHVKTAMIPNPVMDDVINEVLATNPVRKPHKFVFHAAWARGGNVAVKAVKELNFPDSELHAFDYLMATHDHKDSFFRRHNGVDKKTLFTNIAESEYFIYPLYTPYQDVHKDTFSCVVAEAIALGAIVVTYPLGALPEYYDGYCAWLNFPESADPAKMQSEPLSKDLDGKFTCTHNIVDKIKYLEANPQVKEEIRAKGKDYILSRFNAAKVGNMWKDFIDDLLK
jgi:glycosyltransferase involved in cell wall biosynthesis